MLNHRQNAARLTLYMRYKSHAGVERRPALCARTSGALASPRRRVPSLQ
jgi:hypothetical protein